MAIESRAFQKGSELGPDDCPSVTEPRRPDVDAPDRVALAAVPARTVVDNGASASVGECDGRHQTGDHGPPHWPGWSRRVCRLGLAGLLRAFAEVLVAVFDRRRHELQADLDRLAPTIERIDEGDPVGGRQGGEAVGSSS